MCPYFHTTRDWIDMVSIFSTPVVALLAAIIAGYIAWRQVQTTRDKLKIDLFDKRYAVFEEIKKFMKKIVSSANADWTDIIKIMADTSGAKFLFEDDEKITTYIESLVKRAAELHALVATQERALAQGDSVGNLQKQGEILAWYTDQFKEIDNLFKKYLVLKH